MTSTSAGDPYQDDDEPDFDATSTLDELAYDGAASSPGERETLPEATDLSHEVADDDFEDSLESNDSNPSLVEARDQNGDQDVDSNDQFSEELTLPPVRARHGSPSMLRRADSPTVKPASPLASTTVANPMQGSRPSTPGSSRSASALSIRSNLSRSHKPFDRRFQGRVPSPKYTALRNISPILNRQHSRQSSISSQLTADLPEEVEDDAPWEVIRWARLQKLSSQVFSEAGKRAFGLRSCLAVAASIVVGTTKGLVLVFDYQQNLKNILGQGTQGTFRRVTYSHDLVADAYISY